MPFRNSRASILQFFFDCLAIPFGRRTAFCSLLDASRNLDGYGSSRMATNVPTVADLAEERGQVGSEGAKRSEPATVCYLLFESGAQRGKNI